MRVALAAVWAVILTAGIVQTANGLQMDLLGVRGTLEAFPAWSIGLFMAAYYAGYTAGPILAPAVVRKLGHVGVIAASNAAAATVIVLHGLFVTFPVWTLLRLISGFALALTYVAMESWINERAENRVRGRVFSLYLVMQMVGMTLAQGLFSIGDPKALFPFVLTALIFALAIAPAAAARGAAPQRPPPHPFGIVRLFQASPLGVIATVLAGVSWSVVFAFGPVYAQHEGFSVREVGLFMGVAMGAAAVLQFPLGWLSDAVGRRSAIVLMCSGGALASLFGIWSERHGVPLKMLASALMGALMFPLYGLSVAHTNDAVAPQSRVAAAAGLVLLFGLGSIFGPLLTGWAMTVFGPVAFFAVVAATMAASVAAGLLTR